MRVNKPTDTYPLEEYIIISLSEFDKEYNSHDDKKIVVGATAVPHAEILEHIKPLLEEKGYELEVKTFDDYSLLNPAVDEGSLDANFFQHVPYLEESIEAKGVLVFHSQSLILKTS